ncbi:hypothetical protein MBLNU230_g8514t1 [Neophaeotheca triangularis]
MLDSSGTLIWTPTHHYGEIYNFQVQQYKGKPYLTFWAGNDAVGGHGEGDIYMLDQHYEEYRKLSAGNDMGADLHSFEITVDDTAVFSVYQPIEHDISIADESRDRGWIWDCLFQEVDIDSGDVIFQWRATEHLALSESYEKVNRAVENDRWDWLHLNSVEKDAAGNFLISSRYLRAIIYISGETGEVLWRLGGKLNSFQDLSGGEAIKFMGQHDAHWANDEHTAITFFDNRGDWAHRIEDQSKGTRVEVDLEKMTVKLAQHYENPVKIWSTSQGSYQTLPSGNVLIGYGFNGALTEFSPDGQVLCDARFMAANKFGSGDVQSYRNLKFNWTGIPKTSPKVKLHDESLYMSWMGSTEVRGWLLQDSHWESGPIEPVMRINKTEFESQFVISPERRLRRYVRVVALDGNGKALASAEPVDIGDKATWKPGDEAPTEESDAKAQANKEQEEHDKEHDTDMAALRHGLNDTRILLALGLLAVLSMVLVLWITIGRKIAALGQPQQGKEGFAQPPGVLQRLRSKLPGSRESSDADLHLLEESGYEDRETAVPGIELSDEPGDKPER